MPIVNSISIRTALNMSVTNEQINKFKQLQMIKKVRTLSPKESKEHDKIQIMMSNYRGQKLEKLERIKSLVDVKTPKLPFDDIPIEFRIQLVNMTIKSKANQVKGSDTRLLCSNVGQLATLGQNELEMSQDVYSFLNEILSLINNGKMTQAINTSSELVKCYINEGLCFT